MMNKKLRGQVIVVLVLIILSLFIPPLSSEDLGGKSILITVPAVSGGEGRLLSLNVTLVPGGVGRIIVVGSSRIAADTIDSMRIAFITGLLLAGADPFRYNAVVDFGKIIERIEGPSASFAVALAFYSLVKGEENILKGTIITGAISPDGLSVMIGGVPQKTRVACNSGAHTYILPLSNAISDQSSIQNIYRNRNCTVRILGSTGIISSFNNLRGIGQSYVKVVPSYPNEFSAYMMRSTKLFINKSLRMGCSSSMYREAFNESLRQLSRGKYYTAASLAYTAYMKCVEDHLSKHKNNTEQRLLANSLLKEIALARKELENMERIYMERGTAPLYILEALGASEARLWMSEYYAKEALRTNNTGDAIVYLSLSKARYETSMLWMNLTRVLSSKQPIIMLSLMNRTLSTYFDYLNTTISYLKLMVGEEGQRDLKSYFNEIKDLAGRIAVAGSKNVFLRYGLAGELGYRVIGFLDSINFVDGESTNAYLNEEWLSFTKYYSLLYSSGIAPMIPAAYAEYASYDPLPLAEKQSLLSYGVALIIPLLLYSYSPPVPPHGKGVETVSFGRQEIALLLDGWEFIGITATIIVYLVYFREVLRARRTAYKHLESK